jgi:dTDP-4-dehydrorhamnose reductase
MDHVPLHGKPMVIDHAHTAKVRKAFSEVHPEVVINAAAMTDVDRCELEPDAAFAANATSASNLAKTAKELDSFVVQVSTDYVFDGEKGITLK